MHASFSFHQSMLQLAYTTQAWILNFKLLPCKHAYVNAHSNATFKFMSLLPILVWLNFNWSPSFVISLSPPIFVNYFSPFVINDHKDSILDRLRLSVSINGVRIIFPNLVQSRTLCQRYLTRFDPRISFFTPYFKGYLVPCWVKHL